MLLALGVPQNRGPVTAVHHHRHCTEQQAITKGVEAATAFWDCSMLPTAAARCAAATLAHVAVRD